MSMEKRRPVSEDVPPVHHTMHLARELAMQVLFVWDTNAADDDELAEHVVRDRVVDEPVRRSARSMARAAWEMRQSADEWIERLAPQWPPRRQPVVDRNILRLAVWELTSRPTPPKVVIDEAIELAKQYSTEQSAAFVNGVLDAVLKQHKALAGSVRAVTPTDAVAAAGPALRSPDQSAAGVANPDPPGAPHPDSNLES